MTWNRGRIGALIWLVSLISASTAALSCGFEDPKSAAAARGTLNWAYPNALYVTSAVWRAQLDGLITRDERPAAVKALLGYQKAAETLVMLGEKFSSASDVNDAPGISLVLIGPMLWTRFEPTDTGVHVSVHVDGPHRGDVVVITDEPVIVALTEGRITPRVALDLGLMRLYGPAQTVEQVSNWLDRAPRESGAKSAKFDK